MTRGILALLAAALVPAAAASQTPDSARSDTAASPVYRLPAVEATVTRGPLPAERTPFTVTRVRLADALQAHAAMGLDEALVAVPGLLAENRYNLALGTRIAVRGLGARAAFGVRGVRILVDGIPLTLPDGQATLTNIDLASAGTIDVLRGPASVLYGNAAGGVVAIETREPRAPLAEGRILLGDEGRGRPGRLQKREAVVGDRSGRTSWIVAASDLDLAGYRDHAGARRVGLNGRVRHLFGGGQVLSVVLNAAHQPRALSPGALPVDTFLVHPQAAWPGNVATESGEAADQVQLGVRYARQAGSRAMDLAAYGVVRSLDSNLPYAVIRLGRLAGGARASMRSLTTLFGHELALTAGLDAEVQRDARRERDNILGRPGDTLRRDQVDRVGSIGPFAQAQMRILDALDLRAGLRYDAIRFSTRDRLNVPGSDRSGDRTMDAASGFAGLVVRVGPGAAVYGNVATAFQTPTTTELINAPPENGVCCAPGFNPRLEPERVRSVEVGLRAGSGRVSGELVGYTMAVEDALVPYQAAGVDGREFFRNAGRTRHRGIEAALAADLGSWTVATSYALSRVVFVDDGLDSLAYEGNNVPGIPPHHLTVSLDYATQRAFLRVQANATSRYWADDANTAANPPAPRPRPWGGSATLDVRAGAALGAGPVRLRPFVALQNVLDERYASSVVVNAFGGRYYEPAPGRNLILGLQVRWKGSPGEPPSFRNPAPDFIFAPFRPVPSRSRHPGARP